MAARAARRFCGCLVVILSKEKATEVASKAPVASCGCLVGILSKEKQPKGHQKLRLLLADA